MKYRRFEPLNRDLSQLVLGTMVFNTDPDALKNAFELIEAWLEAGGNTFDLAHLYSGGNSERALGKWIEETGRRDEIVILTKGAHHNSDRRRVTPEDIGSDLFDSLARLKTDVIDIYVLHRDDESLPVGPIVESLNAHKKAGRIRCFGGSNWSPQRIDEANHYAEAHGLEGFTVSSPNFSLARQNEVIWWGCLSASDPESRAWYEKTQMPLFSWSSQAMGFFTDRFNPDMDPKEHGDVGRVYFSKENWERRRRAEELGREKGANANQVALAWVIHQSFPTYALIGPRNVEELKSSLEAVKIDLTPEEVKWLNLESDSR